MIIPQLLFSGIIVQFDKLHPLFASQNGVPFIGNVMASRWAYEGLAVAQFKENYYTREFYSFDERRKLATFKKDSWAQALQNKVGNVRRIDQVADLAPGTVNEDLLKQTDAHLKELISYYRDVFNAADSEKESLIEKMTATPETREEYFDLMKDNLNQSLEKFATNKNGLETIKEHEGELIQKKDIIYTQPFHSGFFEAPFYSPSKRLFSGFLDTFWANMAIIFLQIAGSEFIPMN